MILTVTKNTMRGTGTAHTAHRSPKGWRVTWLAGRVLTGEEAVAAMKIAMAAPCTGPRMSKRLAEWAGTLGMPPATTLVLAIARDTLPGPGDATGDDGTPRRETEARSCLA